MRKAPSVVTEDVTLTGLVGPRSAKSVLSNKLGLSASLPEVLGAVGVSVGILAAAAFGVGAAINFGMDSSAKGAIDSVKSAQVLYQSKNATFGTVEQLTAGDTPPLTDKPESLKITVSATNYCGVIKSTSMMGTSYWITAKSGKVLDKAPTAAEAGVTCPTV